MAKQKVQKNKTGMSRIFELAAAHRGMLTLSGILSVIAAASSFVPYIAIYMVIREII